MVGVPLAGFSLLLCPTLSAEANQRNQEANDARDAQKCDVNRSRTTRDQYARKQNAQSEEYEANDEKSDAFHKRCVITI
jgi:hypothetical protein